MLYDYLCMTLAELEALPTLCVKQTCDLKVDDDEEGVRVWLSRCSVADGEPYDHKVTVEVREAGVWVTDYIYAAIS